MIRMQRECTSFGQFISTFVQSWNSFAIDTVCFVLRAYLPGNPPERLALGRILSPQFPSGGWVSKTAAVEKQTVGPARCQMVARLLDAIDRPLLVSDRGGQILFVNLHAQDFLRSSGLDGKNSADLFADILASDRKQVLSKLESGEQDVNLPVRGAGGQFRARIRWLPEPDWLAVYVDPAPSEPPEESEMRQTVQELMQEREITYRNLLAAYLRLQEANRQKTVLLASAAHELKTPLAV